MATRRRVAASGSGSTGASAWPAVSPVLLAIGGGCVLMVDELLGAPELLDWCPSAVPDTAPETLPAVVASNDETPDDNREGALRKLQAPSLLMSLCGHAAAGRPLQPLAGHPVPDLPRL